MYEDQASGKTHDRIELNNMLKALRAGDTLVVWKLDRLGRSLVQLVQIIEDLAKRGIAFESVTEKWDTSTATGRMFVQIIGSMAEYERNLISERTRAGLTAARARGRNGGQPAKLKPKDRREIQALLRDPDVTISDVASRFAVSRGTIYNFLKRERLTPSGEKLP